jgi:hypothetical protein
MYILFPICTTSILPKYIYISQQAKAKRLGITRGSFTPIYLQSPSLPSSWFVFEYSMPVLDSNMHPLPTHQPSFSYPATYFGVSSPSPLLLTLVAHTLTSVPSSCVSSTCSSSSVFSSKDEGDSSAAVVPLPSPLLMASLPWNTPLSFLSLTISSPLGPRLRTGLIDSESCRELR